MKPAGQPGWALPQETRMSARMLRFLAPLLVAAALASPAAAAPAQAPHCAPLEFDVYFESWDTNLNDDARTAISGAQLAFSRCTIARVRITGMAGAPGDEVDNLRVSQQRAEIVAEELANGGWPRARFEVSAIGEQNASVGGVDQPMRRRVHVKVEAAAP